MSSQGEKELSILKSFTEELIGEETLKFLLEEKRFDLDNPLTFYDGFEPSGRIHIAQGLVRALNVQKILSIRGRFIFYLADEFAFLNHKFGGDRVKIRKAGELMIETWKACGLTDGVSYVWASEEMQKRAAEYWPLVIDISSKFTIGRMKKCMTALGKEQSDELSFSSLMYAAMQVADVPFLGVNCCSLGLDQRKILTLNREYAAKIGQKQPPVALMHHMLLGLNGQKMSKSDPENAIFMDDTEQDVNRKIKKAFCPIQVTDGNPILEYVKYIIFVKDETFTILRKDSNGGNITYDSYESLEKDYQSGALHPGDLKPAVQKRINFYLQGVRDYFSTHPEADKLRKEVATFR